jgi:hypothetical protein
MDEITYFDRILGFLKSTNPNSIGVYLFTVGRPTWPDTEGALVSVENDQTQTVPVAWIGPQAPLVNRPYMLHPSGNRYIAGSGKPAVVTPPGVNIPGCLCQNVPATLYMRPNDVTLNGGMFQNCTLQWGPTDPYFANLALGPNTFMSRESFIDSINQTFWYYFNCTSSNFTLTRLYKSSLFGSPYRDSVRFTWPIGSAGNTCVPFLLTTGTVYQGGDTRSQITVTPTGP